MSQKVFNVTLQEKNDANGRYTYMGVAKSVSDAEKKALKRAKSEIVHDTGGLWVKSVEFVGWLLF